MYQCKIEHTGKLHAEEFLQINHLCDSVKTACDLESFLCILNLSLYKREKELEPF